LSGARELFLSAPVKPLAHCSIAFACVSHLVRMLDYASGTGTSAELTESTGLGIFGLQGYANEYWIEHLLHVMDEGVADGDDESLVRARESLFKQTKRLCVKHAQAASSDEASSQLDISTTIHQSGRLDSRLHRLEAIPELHQLVSRVLSSRMELESQQETRGICTFITPILCTGIIFSGARALLICLPVAATSVQYDQTLFSKIDANHRQDIRRLLSVNSCPGISSDELLAFKAEHGSSAFLCPIRKCPRSRFGFSSDVQLRDHQSQHGNKLRCYKADCAYDVGFTSSRNLLEHQRKRHGKQTLRRVSRLRGNLRSVAQSEAPSPSKPGLFQSPITPNYAPYDEPGEPRTPSYPSAAHPDSNSNSLQMRQLTASEVEDMKRAGIFEKTIPIKRETPRAGSDDEDDSRKTRRQRTSGTSVDVHHPTEPGREPRSISPQPRAHRRSVSTQLPSHSNSASHKKKRIPAPLQSTDYHSDESSASGSPHIRGSKLRSLTIPAQSTVYKGHLDAHGQTFLARACARGEYDHAKQRLGERPEDLNVADFAGNTPLQIASLNGYADIVKLLVDAGCNLDCVNYDKDTPLLDAIDNDHFDVVKILLEAGVNPRKTNVNGEEPLDMVSDDLENADAIRSALIKATKKMGERRLTPEEHHKMDEARYPYGPDSPKQSPAPSSLANAATSTSKNATVRTAKTSNHFLYMPMDVETLRRAAGRGDEETVTRILQVRDTFDDPESMVAAARGGHDLVIQLLLALGSANPDPAPVSPMPREHATPILAAIGQENTKVIRLLLDQSNFDPTRRFLGETYYEIARRRRGPNWKDEEQMLKEAYDTYMKSHKNTATAETMKHVSKRKRNESDLAALFSSESEPVKPRRKLVSGRELKVEREKQRQASLVSTVSSVEEPSSHDEAPEMQVGTVSRPGKQLKRESRKLRRRSRP